MSTEKVRLRIGNLGRAVLVTGQAYQDPKDALNEFVSNAADEYAEAGLRGETIRVVLHRRGRHPLIAVEDWGRGMNGERLRAVAQNLFRSAKATDPRTLGEKGIGILAFQQLGGRCDLVTRPQGSSETLVLHLERGKANAHLETATKRRAREAAGTTVYLSDLDPDVLRMLTRRKVVEYLRRRRGRALASGEYVIEVVEARQAERVTPEQPEGIKVDLPPLLTGWGRVEFSLFLAPQPDRRHRVAVVGRAGTTIVDDLTELDEFRHPPWTSEQVSGLIVFEALQQTTGRRAILRDREAFPAFVATVGAIEPAIQRSLERVTREVDAQLADRLADTIRRIFGQVLRELEDVDNPMRTPLGESEGDGALEASKGEAVTDRLEGRRPHEAPGLEDLLPQPRPEPPETTPEAQARPSSGRYRRLPNLAADPFPDGARSRYDHELGIVFYNDRHPDYLMVKGDSAALLDYLATLVAKEYVVYNNPWAAPGDLGEEMVRMVVRVRRYLPRKW